LTGTRFERGDIVDEEKLQQVIQSAVMLLEGGDKGEGEDDLCEQLLRGYRYIMVDEYQDIDEMQYRLVSALSGRNAEEEGQLCILAVGDDDQNIYDFRETNDRYIEKFCGEYSARISYLVENYRSSSNIINASNNVIGVNPGRLKLEHPIRIDKARVELPAGGGWEVQDPLRQGKVLRIQLPVSDRKMGNLQAQAVAQELQPLISLENTPDWNGCAVLARNHVYLKSLRAWCELNDVPYFLAADKEAGLQVTRQRGFVNAVNILSSYQLPLTPGGALQILTPQLMDEQWIAFFDTAFMHLTLENGELLISGRAIVDWLYEYARELRHQPRKGLYLGTVHSAKGLEFRHVGLLDGGWLDSALKINDERRLYYVGMTRAEESLTLCEFASGNPFSRQVSGGALNSSFVGEHDVRLDKEYKQLSLKEIDLSYAGRKPAGTAIHTAIAELKPNDPLSLEPDDGCFLILDKQGREVGRTAKAFKLGIDIERCQVAGIVVRYTADNAEEYRAGMKVDTWEVVVPRISGRAI
jgi:ATP-dependent DNA helicase RecQ